MVQYIDKDAIVTEIEKIIADETESIKSFEHGKNVSEVQRSNARISVLEHIRSLLDTIEVKEVDLDAEINLWVRNLHRVPNFEELNKFARHFFELGLKAAQKGE